MISVCLSSKNPTMRHLKRTHGVNVAWLAEQFARSDVMLVYERSVRMSADIFTKAFTDHLKWQAVCELILVLHPDRLSDTDFLTSLLSTPPSLSGGVSKRSLALSSAPEPCVLSRNPG